MINHFNSDFNISLFDEYNNFTIYGGEIVRENVIYFDDSSIKLVIDDILSFDILFKKEGKSGNGIDKIREIINVDGNGYIVFGFKLPIIHYDKLKFIVHNSLQKEIKCKKMNDNVMILFHKGLLIKHMTDYIEVMIDVNLLDDFEWNANDVQCSFSFIGAK